MIDFYLLICVKNLFFDVQICTMKTKYLSCDYDFHAKLNFITFVVYFGSSEKFFKTFLMYIKKLITCFYHVIILS